jgi:signal peptidase II
MLVLGLVLLGCVGGDQYTKSIAKAALPAAGPRTFLYDTVTLVYAENPGAFLGLGAGLSEPLRFVLFTVVAGVALFLGGALLFRASALHPLQDGGLALIIGGGLGNFIDRVSQQGHVVDFLRLGIGPLHTGIFNIADAAITAGVIFLGLSTFWPRQK